ncbi:MAG: aspartate kinase [Alphaproteobacteria bacterium]|nr:aspartate kinase [Alphaproteobacteria bacterium]
MLVIQKFGGTSVATPDMIHKSAAHVADAYRQGHQVVVVVSAMAGMTDQLDRYVYDVSLAPDLREYDVVVSSGEQVTCGLMALALKSMGLPASSWLSWQVPVRASADFSQSRVKEIDPVRLQEALSRGMIPVVAGFQGVTDTQDLTTFGRGGSDITAVALAVSLKADRCDLYKDVPGVLTADPRIVSHARLIPFMTGQEMLELASLGAKVLQPRAAELALSQGVSLRLLSTFEPGDGTHILLQENAVEQPLVRSLVCQKYQAQLSLEYQDDFSLLLKELERAHVSLDMMSFLNGRMSFSLPQDKADQTKSLIQHIQGKDKDVTIQRDLAKISLVGVGLRGHPRILRALFDVLSEKKITLEGSSLSETRMSILVAEEYAELVVRLLHKVYDLGGDQSHDQELRSA